MFQRYRTLSKLSRSSSVPVRYHTTPAMSSHLACQADLRLSYALDRAALVPNRCPLSSRLGEREGSPIQVLRRADTRLRLPTVRYLGPALNRPRSLSAGLLSPFHLPGSCCPTRHSKARLQPGVKPSCIICHPSDNSLRLDASTLDTRLGALYARAPGQPGVPVGSSPTPWRVPGPRCISVLADELSRASQLATLLAKRPSPNIDKSRCSHACLTHHTKVSA